MTKSCSPTITPDPRRRSVGSRGAGFDVCADVPDAATALTAASRCGRTLRCSTSTCPAAGSGPPARSPRLPDTAIVMLTISRNDDDLFDALRAGASGYLLKDMDRHGSGPRSTGCWPGRLRSPLPDRPRDRGVPRARQAEAAVHGERGAALTSREWEVLDLMRDGLSTSEIAERLFVSRVTVRRHVSGILRKLQVGSREEALEQLAERSGN